MTLENLPSENKSELEQQFDHRSIPSAALRRLIEDVQNDDLPSAQAYDRSHNRHNR